jgi:hypothetical protein
VIGDDALWRPVAFFALMVGLGLRLDTDWQGVAWLLILGGAAGGAVGIAGLVRRRGSDASVQTDGKR